MAPPGAEQEALLYGPRHVQLAAGEAARLVVEPRAHRSDHRKAVEAVRTGDARRLLDQPRSQPRMLCRAGLLIAHRQRLPVDVHLADQRRARQIGQRRAHIRRGWPGERQAQVAGDTILGGDELQEMFFGARGRVRGIHQSQRRGVDLLPAHLAAADAGTPRPAPRQLGEDVHAQAGAPVAGHHVARWNIADDAVDTAVDRDGRLDIGDQADQLFLGVGYVFAALPVAVQLSICQELAGVNLDLVRGIAVAPQRGEIRPIALQRGAEQVGHPVQQPL